MYWAVDRYNGTSSVYDRKRSGRPRSVRTKKAIKAIWERIRRNPVRKQKILSREMTIAPRNMSRILKDNLNNRIKIADSKLKGNIMLFLIVTVFMTKYNQSFSRDTQCTRITYDNVM